MATKTATHDPAAGVPLSRAVALPIGNMADIATAGDLLAQANFLGCRNAGEGFVVMSVCQQTGMSLIDFQQKYHFRQGRFSKQAHALLAELVDRGGSYKIVERSANRAALELTKDANVYLSEITWEQALAEPFVYAGREDEALQELAKPMEKRRLKAKYQTPRSRLQMLWARAVSDGVVAVDPGARGGMYTPEETDDFMPALPPRSEPVEIPAAAVAERVAEAVGSAPAATAPGPQTENVTAGKPAAFVPLATVTNDKPAADPFVPKGATAAAPSGAELCPFPGPMSGIAWKNMETDHLTLALTLECDGFTKSHRDAIEAILAERRIMGTDK